ncbi:hypothetical protein AVEN_204635-1 [Araneus ventricosus]|uniref:Uncharacterized protein n=1 Tax=Araneus ventricosus TaxID=182803 RepID=A0A4Y2T633_ARAVE|nr:hypothetical protein AVEN_204635-1 [Araneus ventricosus]
MHLLKQVLMMLQYLQHLSPTWSCSLELKTGIKLYGSFHRCITGIGVLDQVAVYQLTAADMTKQLLLASLVGISEVRLSLIIGAQAQGPDIALLIFGDHQQQKNYLSERHSGKSGPLLQCLKGVWAKLLSG